LLYAPILGTHIAPDYHVRIRSVLHVLRGGLARRTISSIR